LAAQAGYVAAEPDARLGESASSGAEVKSMNDQRSATGGGILLKI
jgi:hypothetical protein